MKKLLILFLCSGAGAWGQAPAANVSNTPTSMHVFASELIWAGILSGGIEVTGVIDGQPVVLREFKEKNPIAPGSYPIKIIHDDRPHGSETNQRYLLTLQDGKQLTFYLQALCERETSLCYGVSVR